MDQSICPRFEKAISIMNKRWTTLIIYQLLEGSQRFCEIESSIGVSGRVLSERLKDLEKEGIVKRSVYDETPVRIEYSLTNKGESLKPALDQIQKWAENWIETSE
ncbi:winged helix-turn-helix transcriptional regulator [Alkalibacillus haloalkaliphilus]|uniref:winged helix-turn-helix transcriptional regulator n=1 Tax=Alkalibacillus haloalkaliphilus TaxID=94136 RepID=UPI002936D00F|nr:helix-turn-helix domain-containing protein [Alkalibacillus haloalkaliphilus]MDV2582355.1 helix-turn-helix domain-containing protein [Alkalibacillus haloalkaliphilus]